MPVRLVGKVTRLREFSAGDESAFVSQADYPEMFEFMKFRFATRTEAANAFAWLMDLQGQLERQDVCYWAVESAHDQAFVGWAGLGVGPPDQGDEIGWYLLPAHWGRGYATDATAVLMVHGFDVRGSLRMFATCDPDNIGSRRVLEKAKMTCEGLLTEPVQTWRGPRPRLRFATSIGSTSE
jgi:[ribosomal protein S5]-alanine N-acetyltransferase